VGGARVSKKERINGPRSVELFLRRLGQLKRKQTTESIILNIRPDKGNGSAAAARPERKEGMGQEKRLLNDSTSERLLLASFLSSECMEALGGVS